MTYIYRLAGENLKLAESELKGYLKSQKISEKPQRNGRIAQTKSEPNQLKRLALVHEVTKKKTETCIKELEDFQPHWKPENSFSITCKTLKGDGKPPEIEEKLGEKYRNLYRRTGRFSTTLETRKQLLNHLQNTERRRKTARNRGKIRRKIQ